jgi:hypothetical protein
MTHIHISALSSDMNPQVRAWSRRSGSNRRPAAYKLVRASAVLTCGFAGHARASGHQLFLYVAARGLPPPSPQVS